jgi:hypothetical protein
MGGPSCLPAYFRKSIEDALEDDIEDEEIVDHKREQEFDDDASFGHGRVV